MPDTTVRLGLPVIAPSQAQKHVTHNEALQRLDGITQLVLSGVEALTPPVAPVAGEIHALGVGPGGVWAGEDGRLAQWVDPDWVFVTPQEGWRAWDLNDGLVRAYQAGSWQAVVPELQNLDGVGIGAAWDATNRLSVASDAVLLSHAGAGHQLKLNKAASGDTAALLYQSNWTGHAEMGLAGDNDFHLKVSPDGSNWTEALVVDATSGHLSGAAVQASATDTTAGRLARADYAYGPGNVLGTTSQSGGTPTGAVIEQGSNANGAYVRFADGTQICTTQVSLLIGAGSSPFINSGSAFAAAFAALPSVSLVLDQADFRTNVENNGGPARDELSNLGLAALSTTSCTPRLYRVDGGTDFAPAHTALVYVTATGRWF